MSRGKRSSRALAAGWAIALAAGVLATGCGGGDAASTAEERVRFSAAAEAPKPFIERMAKLLETTRAQKECAQLEAINARSYTRFPCPPARSLSKSMGKFEVVGAAAYGTGAVIDYKSGEVPDGAAITLFVAPDRNWGIGRFGVVTEPSTKTDDADSREGYDDAVAAYLDAVRERDCKAFRKVAFLGETKGDEVCTTTFGGTKELAERLKRNPDVEPAYEGGNASYGFYTLETAKPEPKNSTISIIRAGVGAAEEYRVLDVAPSPTAAEQRRVRRAYERQRREGGSGRSMMPGQGEGTGRKVD